jgi:hypothetical protein
VDLLFNANTFTIRSDGNVVESDGMEKCCVCRKMRLQEKRRVGEERGIYTHIQSKVTCEEEQEQA